MRCTQSETSLCYLQHARMSSTIPRNRVRLGNALNMSKPNSDDLLRDAEARQHNTVFPDTVRNEGEFYRGIAYRPLTRISQNRPCVAGAFGGSPRHHCSRGHRYRNADVSRPYCTNRKHLVDVGRYRGRNRGFRADPVCRLTTWGRKVRESTPRSLSAVVTLINCTGCDPLSHFFLFVLVERRQERVDVFLPQVIGR